MTMYMARFTKNAYKDKFGGRMGVQAAGNEKVGDGDCVGSFGPFDRE